jgi:hypothetical protein
MTKTRAATVALIALSLALAACGGSSESSDTTAATRTKNAALPATTLTPRATPTTAARKPSTTLPSRVTTTVAAPKAATTVPTPTTVPASTTVAAPVVAGCNGTNTCKVGDTGPAGGIVFYVATAPQAWGQFMEVRPEIFGQLKWDTCNLNAFDTYGKGAVGDGAKQTAAVTAACAQDGTPANAGSIAAVDAYAQKGFADWFIPSKDELTALVNSKVVKFATDKDLTSYTWWQKPQDPKARSFDVVYGVKKESIASASASTRPPMVEIMSDGTQSYGNPNNRWGWFYIARAFGPKA